MKRHLPFYALAAAILIVGAVAFGVPASSLWILGFVVLCPLMIAMVRYLARQDRAVATRPTAEQVLAERFAHGQIGEQEYRHRLEALRGGPRPLVKP